MKKPRLNKLWEKSFKDLDLGIYLLGEYRVALAPDAKRIIIGALNELNFLDFNGEKEKTVKTDNRRLISSRKDQASSVLKVNSDCSKILLCVPGRFGIKSHIVFNSAGQIISEFDHVGGLTSGDYSTSLDGRLLVSSGNGKDIGVWDWNGNVLCIFLSSIDIFALKSIKGTNYEFNRAKVTPDGSHIAMIIGGGFEYRSLTLMKTPNLDKLLNIDEALRSEMWKDFVRLKIEDTHLDRSLLVANTRLVLLDSSGGFVSIVDFSENKDELMYSYDYKFKEKGSKENFFIDVNGKYIYYTSRKRKEITFNLFDIENRNEYSDLQVFTIDSFGNDVCFIPSYDGKKLVEISSKGRMRHKENIISLLDIKYN